jgi:hypothetical protein
MGDFIPKGHEMIYLQNLTLSPPYNDLVVPSKPAPPMGDFMSLPKEATK